MTIEDQLYEAISRSSYSRSQIPKAIQLLNQGANPNALNGRLFCEAIATGNEALVRTFLSRGAKVTPQALESAIIGDHFGERPKTRRIAEILLNYGADPNATVHYQEFYDDDSIDIPPVLYTPLMVAAVENNTDAAKLLIERGAKVQTRLPNGLTALKVAAQQGNLTLCKLFLDHRADFKGIEQDLVNLAIAKNDTAFFDRLKKLGALPHPVQWPSEFYTLSLPIAQRMLEAGASPNGSHKAGWGEESPLHSATRSKNWPLVELLLGKGAQIESSIPIEAIPDRRFSPAEIQQREEHLLERREDPFGDDDWAAEEKQERSVLAENQKEDLRGLQLFLKHGATPNIPSGGLDYASAPEAKSNDFRRYQMSTTALHKAAYNNRKGAIALLVQAGAKLETKDSRGMTPLHVAIENSSNEAVPALLDAGADIEARNQDGQTPLIMASGSVGSITSYAPIAMVVTPGAPPSLLELLLQRGANVQATNSMGGTALHYASQQGNLPAMRLLLKSGATIEAMSHNGITPLGAACLTGQVEAARLLLEHGANPDILNAEGHTPREFASQPFTMAQEVEGEEKLTPQQKKQMQQLVESYSVPIRAGRQKIAALFRTIPQKKP